MHEELLLVLKFRVPQLQIRLPSHILQWYQGTDEHSLAITISCLRFSGLHSLHPFPLVGRQVKGRRAAGCRSAAPAMMLCSSCGVGELCRKSGGGAGKGVEDQEGEDRRQVQRSPERRDDAPEDVQVRITDRAAL